MEQGFIKDMKMYMLNLTLIIMILRMRISTGHVIKDNLSMDYEMEKALFFYKMDKLSKDLLNKANFMVNVLCEEPE